MITNGRKHSYRELNNRKFNSYVLEAIKDPEETKKAIQFWSKYTEKSYVNLVDTLQKALNTAEVLKQDFILLGKKFKLNNFSPYTNEIKQELFKLNQQTLSLF